MQEIRCKQCDKLLAKGTALDIAIKCPRCKTLILITTLERPERQTQQAASLAAGG